MHRIGSPQNQRNPPNAMQADLTQQVSVVTSAMATKMLVAQISRIVDGIRGGKYQHQMQRIRFAVAKGDAARAKSLKLDLPGILWSGQFKSRKAADLIQHSGLIVADIDHLGDNLQSVRSKLIGSPHLLLHFISPSGTGIKAVFRVSADPAQHVESFNAVATHVYELTGVKIDPSGKDVSRLCFVSHDPELYLNPTEPEPLDPRSPSPLLIIRDANVTPTLRHTDTPDTPTFLSYDEVEDVTWITSFTPNAPHQTNGLFFTIARHVLSKEQAMGRRFTPDEMEALFNHWHAACPPQFLSGSKEDYFAEFCRICAYAEKPVGDSNLDQAWKRACSESEPLEARFVRGDLKRLVALCAHLQEAASTEPFFLSCRQIADLFQIEPMTAQRWMKQLEGLRIIRCVRKGTVKERKASEYRYMDGSLSTTKRADQETDLNVPPLVDERVS